VSLPPANAELIFSADEIDRAIDRVAVRINVDFVDQTVIFLSLLRGALPFTWDLTRRLVVDLEIEFIRIQRYQGQKSYDPQLIDGNINSVEGKTVIVIDDVFDDGLTLEFVYDLLGKVTSEIYSVVLLKKESNLKRSMEPDYVALHAPNRYLVGRGMDLNGKYRDLPAIYAVGS